eukprot:CAMPEP_0114354178 /NCGR_PEP_ID=MMETSP0101-20121206/19229_1 /TAXON_ID=38822 ORGANISM="Pteridomonas danica, Strain PT" /NCGR_SAMPLE_ID=MMETSP0101 /ASSEMBLY_ACC=CAM_ASM_000211 /LENGTH=101 /DNA_ID=CAMNT_0001495405 /DNA_START=310 /DNA_END=613 /DNA_ORIENTATION=+
MIRDVLNNDNDDEDEEDDDDDEDRGIVELKEEMTGDASDRWVWEGEEEDEEEEVEVAVEVLLVLTPLFEETLTIAVEAKQKELVKQTKPLVYAKKLSGNFQ